MPNRWDQCSGKSHREHHHHCRLVGIKPGAVNDWGMTLGMIMAHWSRFFTYHHLHLVRIELGTLNDAGNNIGDDHGSLVQFLRPFLFPSVDIGSTVLESLFVEIFRIFSVRNVTHRTAVSNSLMGVSMRLVLAILLFHLFFPFLFFNCFLLLFYFLSLLTFLFSSLSILLSLSFFCHRL